jgi:outer membrane protein TolC
MNRANRIRFGPVLLVVLSAIVELSLGHWAWGGEFIVSRDPALLAPLRNIPAQALAPRIARQPEPVEPRKIDEPSADDRSILSGDSALIDLPAAFRLAGVENPQIQIARQRVTESLAMRQLAAAQILPNLNGGSNYDNHTGNLQQSNGNILAVNRSALYAGAGANAVAAGTVNIPGLVWNQNLSETLFGYLQTRQLVQERQFASLATRNEMLLQVAVAYLELLRADQARAIALLIRSDAQEVARLTSNYATTGQGRQADADRAATELRQRQTDVLAIEGDVLTASARLAQLLNLDPSIRLSAAEPVAIPSALVDESLSLRELIAIGLLQRPEMGERRAAIQRALLELDAAKLLPFSPNVIVGFSAGTFGGGSNLVANAFGRFGGRTDFDAVAYWTLRNLAVGNRALIDAAAARHNISNFEQVAVLNRVRSEVAAAHARTQARLAQIAINEKAVRSGQEGFREDFNRIRAREGLPIEVLNNLRLLARARMEYLGAIIDYNRAEYELYVALGQPPAGAVAHSVSSPKGADRELPSP